MGSGARAGQQRSQGQTHLVHQIRLGQCAEQMRAALAQDLRQSAVDERRNGAVEIDLGLAYAGDVVSRKCGVPYLYRFELMGTPDDVEAVRVGLADFWKDQTCHQPSQLQSL